jgi:hypothetical protein
MRHGSPTHRAHAPVLRRHKGEGPLHWLAPPVATDLPGPNPGRVSHVEPTDLEAARRKPFSQKIAFFPANETDSTICTAATASRY